MTEVPILEGANLFFWIVCVLIGIIAAVSIVDSMFSKKDEEHKTH
jgi:hypothetical protein